MLGLGFDNDLHTREPERRQASKEAIGDRLGCERGLVDSGGRRVELAALHEVGWLRLRRSAVFVEPAGKTVDARAIDTESCEHCARSESGKRPERRQAEAYK